MRERLLAFFDPSRSLAQFIVGTAALTLALQAAYDFANEPTRLQGGYLLALVALIVAGAVLIASSIRQRVIGRVEIAEALKPGPRAGLIVLVGPTPAAAPASIEYHLPALRHCWLIATGDSLKTAAELYDQYRDRVPHIHWGQPNYAVDPDQMASTYKLVVRILDEEAVEAGLQRGDVIADITGGTKPMTSGVAIACLARDRDMQYMKAPRDAAGQVIEGAVAEPVKIDTAFIPTARLPLA
jgi:hypothetical protein